MKGLISAFICSTVLGSIVANALTLETYNKYKRQVGTTALEMQRRLARGEVFQSGAHPCMGFLTLSEFASEFARWKITMRTEKVAV
jgi:hypothetical protein